MSLALRAALALLRSQRGRRLVLGLQVGLVLAVGLFLVFMTSAMGAVFTMCKQEVSQASEDSSSGPTDTGGPPSGEAVGDIPGNYLTVYREAAKAEGIDWAVLAAVGKQETDHGGGKEVNCISSSEAMGPMQFTPQTWASAGVDGNGDGKTDLCDYEDAIHSAAKYLRDLGAPEDYHGALCGYYGMCADANADYADEVMAQARKYGKGSGGASLSASAGVSAPSGLSGYCTPFVAAGLIQRIGETVSSITGGEEIPAVSGDAGKFIEAAHDYMGVRYEIGTLAPSECNPGQIDCNCLIYLAAKDAGLPIADDLTDDLGAWYSIGEQVEGEPEPGDILMFAEHGGSKITHVGISLGEGRMLHSSIYYGEVAVSDMKYINGYVGARRIIK